MIERPPPELEALFHAEKLAALPGTALQASVRAQIGATIGHAPIGAAAAAGAFKLKLLLTLAIISGATAVGYRAVAPREVRASAPELHEAPVTVASADIAASDVIIQHEEVQPTLLPAPTPRAAARLVSAPPKSQDQSTSEATQLMSAWRALSAHDGATALALVEDARTRNPSSPLDEERLAIFVAALRELGRVEEAARNAEAFIERYPGSVHAELVRAALANR